MKKDRLIELALIGINAEIDKLEKSINKGTFYLHQVEIGETCKSPKTYKEILDMVGSKKAKLEDLKKEKSELEWKV